MLKTLRKFLKVLIIVLLILVGSVAAFAIYTYEQPSSTNIMNGDHSILVLLADTDEQRPGIGAVDMAYVFQVTNGDVKNITTLYPGGMRSKTIDEPAAAGTGKMLLNDALWYNNTTQDAQDAQSIVKDNTNITTDAVIIITPPAVDAVVNSVGPIIVPGYGTVTNNSIDVIRNLTEEKNSTLSRGNATDLIMNPILAAAKNPTKAPGLIRVIIQQYMAGNIVVIPKDLMTQFAVSKGLNSL